MNQDWMNYFEQMYAGINEAKTLAEKVYVYCSVMNFCLSVETPLEVVDELKRMNNIIWVVAEKSKTNIGGKHWVLISDVE